MPENQRITAVFKTSHAASWNTDATFSSTDDLCKCEDRLHPLHLQMVCKFVFKLHINSGLFRVCRRTFMETNIDFSLSSYLYIFLFMIALLTIVDHGCHAGSPTGVVGCHHGHEHSRCHVVPAAERAAVFAHFQPLSLGCAPHPQVCKCHDDGAGEEY